MKIKFLMLTIISTTVFFACKKTNVIIIPKDIDTTPTIDLHNRTLINIPLDTLRKLLVGSWLQKSQTICGAAGCFITYYSSGQEDTYSFLQQDTVKRVKANGVITLYDKATINVSSYDSSWVYKLNSNLFSLSFLKIANDTLIMRSDGGGGSESKLIKKP